MTIRVSPTEPNPTHHISLEDKYGRKVGLILCDGKGDVQPSVSGNPVERTALKTASGNSGYGDFEYPYSPIAQDDWSGGRGSLDIERDSTKFEDSFRLRTSKTNKAFLGPQEQWSNGIRSQEQEVPGNVNWQNLTGNGRYYRRQITADGTFTIASVWLLLRKRGAPGNLTIGLYNDSAGSMGSLITSVSLAESALSDVLSEWVKGSLAAAITSGSVYWIVVSGASTDDIKNCWHLASNESGTGESSANGTTWSSAGVDLYYRLVDAFSEKTNILFKYKEMMYLVSNGTSGAPTLYRNGDRGAADSNSGNLGKLIDATKSWSVNAWTGCVVFLTNGPGKGEHRDIVSNTATQLVVDEDWIATHTTSTEYVILGTNTWSEVSGHGLTAPVQDVISVSKGGGSSKSLVYFAQGSAVNIRKYRGYIDAGVWKEEWAAESNNADYLAVKPIAGKIYRALNDEVKVSSASITGFSSNMVFDDGVFVGDYNREITRLMCYPDGGNEEAIWAFKTDIPYIVPASGNPYAISIREMEASMSEKNGVATLVHDVYIYFSLMNGLERYYGGNLDDIGPNTGNGLPEGRRGPITAMLGYPGKFFVAVDAGEDGYSSLLMYDNSGWHEHYRAPKGERISALGMQVIPGVHSNRLWLMQGNDLIWLPMPNDSTNELEDSTYRYTHEGALILSRMHAGMMDVQKMVKTIKLWTDELAAGEQWIELDYRLNQDEDWTSAEGVFEESPQARMDFGNTYGLAAKRIQIRLRFVTTDATKTPILLAVIVEAVMRIGVKYMYPMVFRLMDDEELLNNQGLDEQRDAMDKWALIKGWADDTSDSMLRMESVSRLWDGLTVFLNPATIKQVKFRDVSLPGSRDVFVCQTTFQEA